MTELDDHELLAQYAHNESEAAFAVLLARYVNLVYSAALRYAGNPHHAEEITQAVFIILARKAGGLRRGTVLSGWLYQTARLTAANFVKGEMRRQRREQTAYMQSTLTEPATAAWEQIGPLLDEAMGRLGEADRNAIVLRYFENKTALEIGTMLKLNEAAAHKRVNRAVEKLRKTFNKRGLTTTATVIAGAVAANSVQAAPAGLVVAISATAAKGAAVTATVTSLVKGTLKIMTYAKLKLAIGISAAIMLAGGAATVVLSSDGIGDNLQTSEIFKKAQEKYASLTSYSDEGQTVAILNGSTITTTFTIRLARPNLYRIEWQQNNESAFSTTKTKTQAVWSAGNGDFLEMGKGVQKQASQENALASATGISGSAAATIPGTFFKMNWGNQLESVSDEKQQSDEKVGDVDCYVFTSELKGKGTTKTIWIGKRDFLIHQVRKVTSAEGLQSALDAAAERNPEIAARLPKIKSQGITSTETHTNIVVNQIFSPTDFAR
jgi:RNA polymerase sigma factor (sigma-70 family)